MRYVSRNRRVPANRAGVLCAGMAVMAVAVAAGCSTSGPLTVGGHSSSPAPGGTGTSSPGAGGAGASSPASSSPAGSASPAPGGGPVTSAKSVIAPPASMGLVTCFSGTTSQYISSGVDNNAKSDEHNWQVLETHGATTSWDDIYAAAHGDCAAAMHWNVGTASPDLVVEVAYTFRTAALAQRAFETSLYTKPGTGPPSAPPGAIVGTRTGLGPDSQLGPAVTDNDIPAVWVKGNVLGSAVAPTASQVKQICLQMQGNL